MFLHCNIHRCVRYVCVRPSVDTLNVVERMCVAWLSDRIDVCACGMVDDCLYVYVVRVHE